jgi:Tfp pilus assembly PilM family ATPase
MRGRRRPRAWRLCFDAAISGRSLVLQDMLLGVNAHVNNDLPLALDRVSIDPDRDARRRDHEAVNAVLASVTERATERLAALYAAGFTASSRRS